MISLSRAEVPVYLRRGKFYQALGEDDSTEFSVPQECFKAAPTVDNAAECLNLLKTLNFWMVDEPQADLMMHLLSSNVSVFEKEDSAERNLLMSLKFGPEYLQLKRTSFHERVAFATKRGMGVAIVEALNIMLADIPDNLCSVAAEVGDLDVLKFARSHQCKWLDAAQVAVSHGHVACVQYAMNHNDLLSLAVEKGQLSSLKALHASGAVLDASLCPLAARHGQLHCLRYLHESGAPWDESTVENAIKSWSNDCLLYAHTHGCTVTCRATRGACMYGNHAALHYLTKRDVPVCRTSAVTAVNRGEYLCMQYAHRLGADWSGDVCLIACLHGLFDFLRYAHEHGCPWNVSMSMNVSWKYSFYSCCLYVYYKSNNVHFDALFRKVDWYGRASNVVILLLIGYFTDTSTHVVVSTCVLSIALECARHVLLMYPVQIEHCFPKVRAYKTAMYMYLLITLLGCAIGIWVVAAVLYAICMWCWACVAGFLFV